MDDAEQIASRFFSPREKRCLLALPAELRTDADCLDQIEVSLAPGEAAELLGDRNDSHPWLLHSLVPAAEFLGALAVQREDARVNCWKWNGPP